MLVDKEIRKLVDKGNLIVNFNEDHLNSISYDVVIDKFIVGNKEIDMDEYLLSKSEFIYVRVRELLKMPNNLCCMVIEKNSLMRKGLKVDGPLYQPGHNTCIFLRILNISQEDILLKRDMRIAQLLFMELNDIPNCTYDIQSDAHYNNEDTFRN